MTTAERSDGRRVPDPTTGNAAVRWPYRVAICVFPEASSTLAALGEISTRGANPSDMAVIAPSRSAAETLLSSQQDCPALFFGEPGKAEWQHMGTPASYTVRRLADVADWASERTAAALTRDLAQGCVVLLVYGLRGMLQALMADVLLHVDASRVELHDIPPGHLAS